MATNESKGQFFYETNQFESIRITNRFESRIGMLYCEHLATMLLLVRSTHCRTAFPAQHLRPSDVLSCWPDDLELSPVFYPGSNEQHRLFLAYASTRNVLVRASSSLGVLNDYALYKSTHLCSLCIGHTTCCFWHRDLSA